MKDHYTEVYYIKHDYMGVDNFLILMGFPASHFVNMKIIRHFIFVTFTNCNGCVYVFLKYIAAILKNELRASDSLRIEHMVSIKRGPEFNCHYPPPIRYVFLIYIIESQFERKL